MLVVLLLAVGALRVGGAGASPWGGGDRGTPAAAVSDSLAGELDSGAGGFPPPASLEHERRLLPPVAAPLSDAGTSAYLWTQDDGRPVAWDPCRSIDYVVSGAGKGVQLLDLVTSRLSALTGLAFTRVGATTEVPSRDRSSYQPRRYGQRFAPVLLAWTTPEQVPGLAGDVAGQGGPQEVRNARAGGVLVSGTVSFDAPQLATMSEDDVLAVMEHEFGHLVGLGHVQDRAELMYPELGRYTARDFGPGDRRGLSALGQGGCAPWV